MLNPVQASRLTALAMAVAMAGAAHAELEGDDGVADIVEIAAARRIPGHYVGRAKLDKEARSEAPQRVWIRAEALYLLELAERRLRLEDDLDAVSLGQKDWVPAWR